MTMKKMIERQEKAVTNLIETFERQRACAFRYQACITLENINRTYNQLLWILISEGNPYQYSLMEEMWVFFQGMEDILEELNDTTSYSGVSFTTGWVISALYYELDKLEEQISISGVIDEHVEKSFEWAVDWYYKMQENATK